MGLTEKILVEVEERLVHDRFAPFFAKLTRRLDPVYARVAREVCAHAKGEILDVGMGTGDLIAHIASQSPASQRIVGLDINPHLVQQGQQRMDAEGYADRVELIVGDGHELPFADARFSVVVSTGAIHHWERPEVALAEQVRVLAPGGTLLVFDQRRPQDLKDINRAWRQGFFGTALSGLTDDKILALCRALPLSLERAAVEGRLIGIRLRQPGTARSS